MSQSHDDQLFLQGLVKGRVQGVFFRAETQATAIWLGLSGWVRNTDEGHVEVLIGGDPEAVEAMREWLWQGPPRARVDALELVEIPESKAREGFDLVAGEFQIRR